MRLVFQTRGVKRCGTLLLAVLLSACSALQYQPLKTLNQVNPNQGYRVQQALATAQSNNDDVMVVLSFSGGGTRAAAFGYGVLETLKKQVVYIDGRRTNLMQAVDLVYGISGGSVLATYFGLHGADTINLFEKNFLKQNLQKVLVGQLFSASNWPRLTSPEFGRGDLLQEQLDLHLFHGATYDDLLHRRKGPFTVISATDMGLGSRLDFTQDYFDLMCLDLTDMPLARAVAASSAVPLVFAPITLNNHGGQCAYQIPAWTADTRAETDNAKDFRHKTRQEYVERVRKYQDSAKRPYVHLLDGGLTDNLGLRSLLDATELYSQASLYDRFSQNKINKIIIINVNAQTQALSDIDERADVPGFRSVLDAIVNIPIDKYSEDTLRQFQKYVDWWNENKSNRAPNLYFISVNLLDLPESALREKVVHIPTTFYLANYDVNNLRTAAAQLLTASPNYQRMVRDLSAQPIAANPHALTAPESASAPMVEDAAEEAQGASTPE